jgi:hypothetical protein
MERLTMIPYAYTIKNNRGLKAIITNYGGTLLNCGRRTGRKNR